MKAIVDALREVLELCRRCNNTIPVSVVSQLKRMEPRIGNALTLAEHEAGKQEEFDPDGEHEPDPRRKRLYELIEQFPDKTAGELLQQVNAEIEADAGYPAEPEETSAINCINCDWSTFIWVWSFEQDKWLIDVAKSGGPPSPHNESPVEPPFKVRLRPAAGETPEAEE